MQRLVFRALRLRHFADGGGVPLKPKVAIGELERISTGIWGSGPGVDYKRDGGHGGRDFDIEEQGLGRSRPVLTTASLPNSRKTSLRRLMAIAASPEASSAIVPGSGEALAAFDWIKKVSLSPAGSESNAVPTKIRSRRSPGRRTYSAASQGGTFRSDRRPSVHR